MEVNKAGSAFLPGECAWIIGASSGIGRAVALRLAGEGVRVVASGRRQDLLGDLCGAISEAGGQAISLPLDVTDESSLGEAPKKILAATGRLDIIVLCAGLEMMAPFQMLSPAKWRTLWDVNVVGPFEAVRHSLKLLKDSGKRENAQGRVIFTSSAAALRGWPAQSAYSACKAAVLGGMRSLAVELAPFNIRVNAVVPGMVQTDMQKRLFSRMPRERQEQLKAAHPLGLGKAEEVAASIAFLASYDARWITGESLVVDGGMSVA